MRQNRPKKVDISLIDFGFMEKFYKNSINNILALIFVIV